MTEFEEDSINCHGRILTGQFKHFCADFDYLPIDETCFQFQYCLCEYTDWDMNLKNELKINTLEG